MKLNEALKGLICEIASIDGVVDSIKKRQRVIIYYDGDEPGGRGIREVEPVCLGTSKAGNKILRAWDEEGASHTAYKGEQPLPGWRIFRLDKILSIKPTGEIYNTPRPGYNFNGDKSMVSVIINAKFDNQQPAAATAAPEPTTPVTSPTLPTPTPTPTEQENLA
jgi:predicted DNA-binding transcriptional regulator YafY